MKSSQRNGPLSGLRVLDIAEGVAGPFCAKLLGDLGADVIKVEPPGGDVSRTYGPFPNNNSDPERSASFFYFNTSKRSIVIDRGSASGRATLQDLVASHNIVIAGESNEQLAIDDLSFETFNIWNPRIILTTISGFGSFGPYSSYEHSHLINCATGGWAHLCGMPDKEPLQAGGAISETLTGAFAAVAALLAARGRKTHDHGEHVDVSAQEAVLAGAQLPTLLYEYRGLVPGRYSSVGSGAGAAFMLKTDDGYIGLNALTRAQWFMLCDFLGRGDIAENPDNEGISWMNPDMRIEDIRNAFAAALAGRDAEQLFHQAEAARVPFGLVPDIAKMFTLPPLNERNFFVPLSHPCVDGEVLVPGLAFQSAAPEPMPYRPPLLGEHEAEIRAELAVAEPQVATATAEISLPLEGVRVLDLSMFFAGPVSAQICADAGADVIKVESIQRIDGWRGAGANFTLDLPSWEISPYFNWVNRGKKDITLDLTDPRGADIIKKMVRDADIIIENYTPRVMAKFGLSYDVLKAINPRLVMLSLSGFGNNVSWRDYVAFGMSTEQMSGVAHLTGYADDEPLFTGMTGGDLFAGVMGTTALLAALEHRDRSGVGQHINFSQLEACNQYIGDVMTGYSLAGRDPARTGNHHPTFAPQGIYQCRPSPDAEYPSMSTSWIGITCKTDAQWCTLAALIGKSEWGDAGHPYATAPGRQGASEIDAAITVYCITQDHLELMHLLQRHGVPAGAVMRGPEMLNDPHLQARGAFLAQDRPGLGEKNYPNQPYRFSNAGSAPNVRAPLLGEHIEQVFTDLVGLTDDNIVELVIDDVTGTVPLALT